MEFPHLDLETLRRITSSLKRIENLLNQLLEQSKISQALTDIVVPALQNWKWHTVYKTSQKIASKKDETIIDITGSGWLVYVRLVTDNPDLRVIVTSYSGQSNIELNVSIRDLVYEGQWNSIYGFRVLECDGAKPLYVAEYGPGTTAFLGLPFRGRHVCRLYNASDREATYTLIAWLILVER